LTGHTRHFATNSSAFVRAAYPEQRQIHPRFFDFLQSNMTELPEVLQYFLYSITDFARVTPTGIALTYRPTTSMNRLGYFGVADILTTDARHR
jgi:hypothetical protein